MAIYGDGMGEAEMKDVNMVLYGVPNGIKWGLSLHITSDHAMLWSIYCGMPCLGLLISGSYTSSGNFQHLSTSTEVQGQVICDILLLLQNSPLLHQDIPRHS